jgi:hypothetical protein
MTDSTLSPASQVVLDAFTEDNFLHDWKHNHYNTEALASALRAVVDQIILPKYQYAEWELAHAICEEIFAIADELETQ